MLHQICSTALPFDPRCESVTCDGYIAFHIMQMAFPWPHSIYTYRDKSIEELSHSFLLYKKS